MSPLFCQHSPPLLTQIHLRRPAIGRAESEDSEAWPASLDLPCIGKMATHHRNPVSSRKNQTTQGRSQRPGLGSKRNSSHGVLSKSNGKNVRIREDETDEDAMAASFLQYWYASRPHTLFSFSFLDLHVNHPDSATCEKQIAVPSNSILYCSEGYAIVSTS